MKYHFKTTETVIMQLELQGVFLATRLQGSVLFGEGVNYILMPDKQTHICISNNPVRTICGERNSSPLVGFGAEHAYISSVRLTISFIAFEECYSDTFMSYARVVPPFLVSRVSLLCAQLPL